MPLLRIDQAELLTALHAAEGDRPFAVFLERFRRRVGAREAVLVERTERTGWTTRRAYDRDGATITEDHREIMLQLRPGRVYPLADIDPHAAHAGRVVRSVNSLGDQWLFALSDADPFVAADSALMAGLAPHLAIACENRARLEAARADQAAAETALARGGIGWTLVDGSGERLSGAIPPASRRELARMAGDLDMGAHQMTGRRVLGVHVASGGDGRRAAALVLFRTPRKSDDRAGIFAAELGVLPSHAPLAIALADGLSLAEAAVRLGLTLETARNYSKRLYATTGAHGQGDLVRLVWAGLSTLA